MPPREERKLHAPSIVNEISVKRKLLRELQPLITAHGMHGENEDIEALVKDAVSRNNIFRGKNEIILAHPVVTIHFNLDREGKSITNAHVESGNELVGTFVRMNITHGFSREFMNAMSEHDERVFSEIGIKLKQKKPRIDPSEKLKELADESLKHHAELSRKITAIMTHSNVQACKLNIVD